MKGAPAVSIMVVFSAMGAALRPKLGVPWHKNEKRRRTSQNSAKNKKKRGGLA